MKHKSINIYECVICGRKEETESWSDNWAELSYGVTAYFCRAERKDICPDCLKKILKGKLDV